MFRQVKEASWWLIAVVLAGTMGITFFNLTVAGPRLLRLSEWTNGLIMPVLAGKSVPVTIWHFARRRSILTLQVAKA